MLNMQEDMVGVTEILHRLTERSVIITLAFRHRFWERASDWKSAKRAYIVPLRICKHSGQSIKPTSGNLGRKNSFSVGMP